MGELVRNTWNMVNSADNLKYRQAVENALRRPVEEIYAQWGKAQPFLLECNNQALKLADML
jgi:hypothetical protein